MFKIYDGREHFYQWDLDRKLIVEDPSVIQVHFCNRTDDCSLVCETYVEDGITLVNVPNILLQTDWKIHVYAYDGKHTKHDKCYEVKSRTKPSDYMYTETEVLNWEEMKEAFEEMSAEAIQELEEVTAAAIEDGKAYTDQKAAAALEEAKDYTDEQAGTLVKKEENWTDKPGNVTKIILPSATYYYPDDNENQNSFYIQSDWYTWMVHTKPGETLVFDILENKENKLVTVIDEATGKEKAKMQDTWGIYDNIEYCYELGSDLGCIFYCYNEAKIYADEVGNKATEAAVEESNQYTDKKIGSLLNGYASGEVIAIDDISPVNTKIDVGMSSKNLLDVSSLYGETVSINGGTITCNEDGGFAVSGTPTAGCSMSMKIAPLPSGVYTLSLHGNSTNFACSLYFRDKDNNTLGSLGANPNKNYVTFNTDTYVGYTSITVEFKRQTNNVEMSGIAYCQIEKGSIPTGYTPYFTEWDIAGVCAQGKNLFGGTFEIGGIAGGSGGNYNNAAQIRSDYIPIKQGNYYLSTLGSEYTMSGIFFYDENTVMTKAVTTVIANRAFTTDTVGASYMRYRIARADGANITEEDLVKVKSAFQFEVGTSATSYEPYVEPIHYEAWQLAEANGKIEGIYPSTTLIPEVNGVVMDVEYSRDLNKAFAELEQAIISLGGNI